MDINNITKLIEKAKVDLDTNANIIEKIKDFKPSCIEVTETLQKSDDDIDAANKIKKKDKKNIIYYGEGKLAKLSELSRYN